MNNFFKQNLILLLIVISSSITAQTVTVKKTGGDFNNVTDAIASLSNGGTIKIFSGTYHEDIEIDNYNAISEPSNN